MPTADWSTSQLAEFVAVVSATRDEASALRSAVERAAEAFDAEFAAIIRDGTVFCAVGFPQDANPDPRLLEIGEGGRGVIGVPGIGECPAVAAPFEGWLPGSLIVARAGDEGFSPQERNLLRAMGRVLALALDRIERERLLEGLSRIQRSISLRAPLQVVLEAITSGAAELLGTEVATLRVLDPDDDGHLLLVSASGLS